MRKNNTSNSTPGNSTPTAFGRLPFWDCNRVLLKAVVLALVGFASLMQVACDDFVGVSLPDSQLTAPAVFEDKATANAAMVAVYAKIRENGLLSGTPSGLSHQLGNYTDELTYFGNPLNNSLDFYNNTLLASDRGLADLWNSSYNQIYAANAVLQGVQQSTTLPQAAKDEFMGEAVFVRALLHFYLINLYGAIPYVTSTNYKQNSVVSKKPVNEVYLLIKNDLNQAISLLPEEYTTEERVRPNKATAQALLARLNLYTGAWEEASNAASAVLNNTDLYSWNDLLDLEFLKESTATIWQLAPGLEGKNTEEAITFIFTLGPPPLSALSDAFVASFAANDLRKSHWIGTVTSGSSSWYYPNKYKESEYTGSSVEYSILFRLAEMYLIRAEARAHQGDLIGAREDLNKVRSRAGLGDTPTTTAEEIISAVLQERRFEFFTELGHRFFDLKRTNTIDAALSPLKPGWDAKDKLFPIPASEILLNPNLGPQNPGY
jgi:hypothetical protein